MSPYLTIQEVAELARCEHRTVRRAIRSGELRASLIGGRWIVRTDAAEDWFEARANDRVLPLPSRVLRINGGPAPASREPGRPGSVAGLEAIREKILGP